MCELTNLLSVRIGLSKFLSPGKFRSTYVWYTSVILSQSWNMRPWGPASQHAEHLCKSVKVVKLVLESLKPKLPRYWLTAIQCVREHLWWYHAQLFLTSTPERLMRRLRPLYTCAPLWPRVTRTSECDTISNNITPIRLGYVHRNNDGQFIVVDK